MNESSKACTKANRTLTGKVRSRLGLIDPYPKWRPKIQISQNQKRIPPLERTPLL